MNRILYLFFCLSQIFHISQVQGNTCYSEYWQKLFWQMWEKNSLALGTYIKIDTGNHFQNVRSIEFNEQLEWTASENLFVEVHYAYLHGRSITPHSPWRWQHRLELEVNPVFQLPCSCILDTRNRLEIRRIQNEPKTQYRLRQRMMLVIPFKNSAVKAFSIYNEVFYNISTRLFTQDRICPCQFTFSLSDKVDLDVFFLIHLFDVEGAWKKSAVLGTELSF